MRKTLVGQATALHKSVLKISWKILSVAHPPEPGGITRGGGTLGISGWGCAAGIPEPLAYTRASSAEFC